MLVTLSKQKYFRLLLLLLPNYRVFSINTFPWFIAFLWESWFTFTWTVILNTKFPQLLTNKLAEHQFETSFASSSLSEQDNVDNLLRPNVHHNQRMTLEILLEAGEPAVSFEDRQNMFGAPNVGRDSHEIHGSITYSAITKQLDVEELEMLLEAYFVQINGMLNKLSTLRVYVDDTEDYISIMLDDKQNHLLQMGVMLTTTTLVVSPFVVVTGIFGMNIHIELFDPTLAGMKEFL